VCPFRVTNVQLSCLDGEKSLQQQPTASAEHYYTGLTSYWREERSGAERKSRSDEQPAMHDDDLPYATMLD
jgi:hypothetical protein